MALTRARWGSWCFDTLESLPALAPLPDDDPVIGCICPECNGGGTAIVCRSFLRDWDTGEYADTEEIACEACDGLGYLTTPLTEADVAA